MNTHLINLGKGHASWIGQPIIDPNDAQGIEADPEEGSFASPIPRSGVFAAISRIFNHSENNLAAAYSTCKGLETQ